MNVIAIEEELERGQIIIIYTPTIDGKYVVMDYVFHMLGF
jgi:hypothetical protein